MIGYFAAIGVLAVLVVVLVADLIPDPWEPPAAVALATGYITIVTITAVSSAA